MADKSQKKDLGLSTYALHFIKRLWNEFWIVPMHVDGC